MIDSDTFISKLKTTPQESLKLSEFISSFPMDAPIPMKRRIIFKFIKSVENTFPEFDRELVLEGWEKIVTCNLYSSLFKPMDELTSNANLKDKIKEFSWIKERNLDLPFPDLTFPPQVFQLDDYSCPRDKLVVLLNITNIVNEIIRKIGDKGNDFLLPALILTIIRSDPNDFISHLKYIMRYRNPEKISDGIVQFTLTNMMGAVSFIYNLSPKSLTLTFEDSVFLKNSKFKNTIEKSKDFFGSLFTEVKNISSDAVGKVENFFKKSQVKEEDDYELQLALALSASLQESNALKSIDTVNEK